MSQTSTTGNDDDFLSDANLADPYPLIARLRQHDPVHWSERYKAWFVLRYDDVLTGLRDPEFSSDRIRPVFEHKLTARQQIERGPTYKILENWMVFRDPPDHTRLRRLVSRAFTPRAVEAWRPLAEAAVEEMIRDVAPKGHMDLVHDFAYPIPAIVIAEMMGVPAEERDLFKSWSDDVMILVFGARGVEGRRERAQKGLMDLADYLRTLIRKFRAEPADNVIGTLITAQEGDDLLTDDEVLSTLVLMLFGGHETTTNLIANGTLALLRHPDQVAKLRARPELMKSTIEELLRFDGPSKMEVRMMAADATLGGRTLRAGDMVYLVQDGANRDPAVFDRPDELDIERDPNGHIEFGWGIHYCIGAAIARLEGAIAIDAVIRRLPDLAAGPEPERWHPTLISRGMASFPVSYTPSVGDPRC